MQSKSSLRSDGFDRARLVEGAFLPPEDFDDFQRLCKSIRYTGGFRLFVVSYGDSRLRDQVIDRLSAVLAASEMTSRRVWLGPDGPGDVADLIETLAEGTTASEVVHVVEADGAVWHQRATWEALNIRREVMAERVQSAVVVWLHPEAIADFARNARDLWAWRGGVYEFVMAPERRTESFTADHREFDPRSLAEKMRRITELREAVMREDPLGDELLAPLAFELGTLYKEIGEPEMALGVYREIAHPVYERLGDARSKAVTMGQIADVLASRGELDESLRIRREEELPVYERLGDARSKAVTMGKIADVLASRGELDESLRIRREEQLPVYERLGDARSKAVTMGKIADVLASRGELDESLRIRREELPVYERLGDARSKAVTIRNIADIEIARGNLDTGVMLLEQAIALISPLGAVRDVAVFRGKIADVLASRGELDESLRIRREEQLPVYERLGDARSKAVTMGKIADVLASRGELDEALRIYREEALPVYERLGDAQLILVCQTKIALILNRRGRAEDANQVKTLLREAYQAAADRGYAEAGQIKVILTQLNIKV